MITGARGRVAVNELPLAFTPPGADLQLPYTELTGSRPGAGSIAGQMRRPLVLAFALALAVVPSAGAALSHYRSADKDLVLLTGGRGVAAFSARGAIFGKVGRGRLTIADLPRGARTTIKVTGAEHVTRITGRMRVYRGGGMRFRVAGGEWRIRVRGIAIYAAAMVRGTMTLRGTAGKYAIEGSTPRRWPREARRFTVGD